MMRIQMHRAIATALCVLMVLTSKTVFAQTTDRSGIEGKVLDDSKAVIPGVTVTIRSPALQRPELTTVTDGEGRYRFAGLPSGVYEATFDLTGFRTVRLGDIRLAVGFIATQDVSMAIGTLGEAITVTGESPVVDIRTTTVSTNFSREAMETVPTSRSVWQIIAMSPGMRNTATTPDVGGSMMGTQESYNNYGSGRGGNVPTIEGINVRDAGQDASVLLRLRCVRGSPDQGDGQRRRGATCWNAPGDRRQVWRQHVS